MVVDRHGDMAGVFDLRITACLRPNGHSFPDPYVRDWVEVWLGLHVTGHPSTSGTHEIRIQCGRLPQISRNMRSGTYGRDHIGSSRYWKCIRGRCGSLWVGEGKGVAGILLIF